MSKESPSQPPSPLESPEARTPSRARRALRWVAILLVIVSALVALRLTLLAPDPLTVTIFRVIRGPVEQTVSNTRAGTLKARRRARLSPEIGGRVVELPHREGDRVKEGQLLVRLDASIPQARLELAREDVKATQARSEEACLVSELAQIELRRFAELQASGIASEQQLDALTSERDRSLASCRASRASLEQARAQERLALAELALTEIRAPFDGVIAELEAELGEWVTPSPPAMPLPAAVDLLDPASLYVAAPIDEMDAERVQVGQEVRLSVDSRQGEDFPGVLVRVAPYVLDREEQNRTVEIEAEFQDPRVAASLLPGTSADVEVISSRRQDVLQVPTSAIGQGDTVLVVVDGRLVEKEVGTGLSNWKRTEITSGLGEGDLVVTSRSSSEVRAGAHVRARENP